MQKTISVIDLKARSLCGNRKLYAVVKADAYGHGAEKVSQYIEDAVDGFCVAIVDEGASLRIAGITKEILVFTPPLDESDVLRARTYNLTAYRRARVPYKSKHWHEPYGVRYRRASRNSFRARTKLG